MADDWAGMSAGSFYTGLTRDDVGGLRYLLETNNYNLEPLLPDVHGAGTNSSNYVNLALRGGVDKITFVREMVDPITGEFLLPVTNQYTDTYFTNGVLMQQQLERVTTRPDFIFSAYDGADRVSFVEATGTTNWLNNALPGVGGPGTIRPQVKIAYSKFGFPRAVGTSDSDDAFQMSNRRWASFNGSTNPPVIYPTGATVGAGNPWTVRLVLINTDGQQLSSGYFAWHLPVSLGTAVRLETSTDLVNWTTLTTVTNCGVSLLWEHRYSKSSGYFRAAPQ